MVVWLKKVVFLLKNLRMALVAALIITSILVVIRDAKLRWGREWAWAAWANESSFGGQTTWEWFELLIIPLVLALGAFFLQRSERNSEREFAERRRKDDQDKAKDQQQETALQLYIDRMTGLLLNEDHPLRSSASDDEVRVVARTRTLTTLGLLGPFRKGMLLRFLYEAKLISTDTTKNGGGREVKEAEEKSIVDMSEANLSGVQLLEVNLAEVNLDVNSLDYAILNKASLGKVNLSGINLCGANLSGANLSRVILSRAYLIGANLSEANLREADLTEANLRGADLSKANLSLANLTNADLTQANLSNSNMTRANLKGAILLQTNLYEVSLTDKQYADQKSFESAKRGNGEDPNLAVHTLDTEKPKSDHFS